MEVRPMENQLMADKLIHLEQMLQEQQNELAFLREALARKTANRPAPTVLASLPVTAQPKTPDTTRRKMLKRMGVAVLAGGAALGITAATYAPAESRISVNPNTNIGAVITRTGKSITNIPTASNVGLLASADNSFDASSVFSDSSGDVGVFGVSSSVESIGVYGYTNGLGTGVYGAGSALGTGVKGYSPQGIGVIGQTGYNANPAIMANNAFSSSGVALQIEQGDLTVFGAGVGTGAMASTTTAAFVQKTTNGVGGNIPSGADYTIIDNPLCNSRPDALLFVTPNLTPNGASGISENKSVAVFYSSGHWNIYHEDFSSMPTGVYFNVLIINP
jgi:hypothetical protein